MSGQIDTRSKTYKTAEEFNHDAERMLKDGWNYDAGQVRRRPAGSEVVTYPDAGEYNKDLKKRTEAGWTVQQSMERTQRSGCMRIIMLGGIGALVFKPKPQVVVTYAREETTVTYTRPKN